VEEGEAIRMRLIEWEVLVMLVEWEVRQFEEGESSQVKKGKAFKRVAVKGAGEAAVGDQNEEEEAREVLHILLILLMLQVFLFLLLILMVEDMVEDVEEDAVEHVEEDAVEHVEEDAVEHEVVTLMREARVERLLLMLMLQLLVEWEEVHRSTEGEVVKYVEENKSVDCAEIVSPVEIVGEEDVEEEEED